jgi:hypothetical protein
VSAATTLAVAMALAAAGLLMALMLTRARPEAEGDSDPVRSRAEVGATLTPASLADQVLTARFAVGGDARRAGERATSQVLLRRPLAGPPVGWTLDAAEAGPGVVHLRVDAHRNAHPRDLELQVEPGTADPMRLAVSLRSARAGDFAASGVLTIWMP